jgi:hypothetical protein
MRATSSPCRVVPCQHRKVVSSTNVENILADHFVSIAMRRGECGQLTLASRASIGFDKTFKLQSTCPAGCTRWIRKSHQLYLVPQTTDILLLPGLAAHTLTGRGSSGHLSLSFRLVQTWICSNYRPKLTSGISLDAFPSSPILRREAVFATPGFSQLLRCSRIRQV